MCVETLYEAVYRGLILARDGLTLRTGRTYWCKRGRGRNRDGALKQSTNMKPIHHRPAAVEARAQIGHWEGDLVRHEALFDRAEVEDLRRCAVAAA